MVHSIRCAAAIDVVATGVVVKKTHIAPAALSGKTVF